MKKKFAEWQEEFKKAQAGSPRPAARTQGGGNKKANEEYSKVYRKRSEFMKEEMTGFVWLYLRK